MLETTRTSDQLSTNWRARFFTIWTGQAFSLFGSGLVQFALVWWLTMTTGSATVLATATVAAWLPMVVVGPFAGALVDRWSRRQVMIVADATVAVAGAALAYLFAIGAMEVWHVYAILLVRATAGAFHLPAMQASTSLMVPKDHLSRVAGVNQALQGAMQIVAPPAGALLLSVLPLHGVLLVDVGTALLAIVPLLFLSVPQPKRQAAPAGEPASLRAEMLVGLRYVWQWPGLLILMIGAALINFLIMPAYALAPLLVVDHFGGEAFELGWLNSAEGIGIVLGGLLLGAWGGFRRRVLTVLLGIMGMGIAIIAVGLTPATAFALAVAGMLGAGLMMPLVNGPVMAIVQATVAPEVQGRVITVLTSASMAMVPLSMLVAGPVADALGVRSWYVMGGIACVLLGLVGLFIPAVMHLEDGRQAPEAAGLPLSVTSVAPAYGGERSM